MKYKRFEDLPVWQAAIELAVAVFRLTESGGLGRYGGVRNQIERAAVSVSNNIAEGFDRGTHEELLTFLYIALGSAAEVRSMLSLLGRLRGDSVGSSDLEGVRELTLDVSRQLGAWVESLKNSQDRGPRYRNQTTRRASHEARKQRRFLEELRRIQTGNGDGRFPPAGPTPPEPESP